MKPCPVQKLFPKFLPLCSLTEFSLVSFYSKTIFFSYYFSFKVKYPSPVPSSSSKDSGMNFLDDTFLEGMLVLFVPILDSLSALNKQPNTSLLSIFSLSCTLLLLSKYCSLRRDLPNDYYLRGSSSSLRIFDCCWLRWRVMAACVMRTIYFPSLILPSK